MNTQTDADGVLFYPALAGVTVGVSLSLVIATGAYPDGERGAVIVSGLGALLMMLTIALSLRAAYSLGFNTALRSALSEALLHATRQRGQAAFGGFD